MYLFVPLAVLALIWLIVASVEDIRKREIANWLNFSLIIFAMGVRFFYSLFSENFNFFYQGVIGLMIFFFLGYSLYYLKFFAGGDAKLMIALGSILPFSENFYSNLNIFLTFFLVFLFVSTFYIIFSSIFLSIKNFYKFQREFKKQIKTNEKLLYLTILFLIIFIILGILENLFFLFGIIFLVPYLYLYAKAIEESCMVKIIKTSELTEGDWLYKDVRVGAKIIKSKWDGLTKAEILLLKKKYKKIKIKYGIPFSPVFLISFIIIFFIWKFGLVGLWNPFW